MKKVMEDKKRFILRIGAQLFSKLEQKAKENNVQLQKKLNI